MPALIGWGLTAWMVGGSGSAPWVLAAAAVAGGCALGCLAVRRWCSTGAVRAIVGIIVLACAVSIVLAGRVLMEEHVRADPQLTSAAERGTHVEVRVRVSGFEESSPTPFGERRWARGDALVSRGEAPVLLWLPNDSDLPSPSIAPGLEAVARGTVERLETASNAAFAIRVSEFLPTGQTSVTARIGAVAADLRQQLRAAAADVPGAELVPGFAVGDTALVGEQLEHDMLASSLTHLTAVSGANCALVTGAAIWMLSLARVGRRGRVIGAAAMLTAFVIIVGPDASVQRAAVMASVVLVSGFGGKKQVSLPALGVAVCVLLVADPWQALQPGFALSVAATGAILIGAAPVTRWLRERMRLPNVFALPVAIALVAQLACAPLILLLQPGLPAVGVLANVVAAPAAPWGTGIGLIAVIVTPLSAQLGQAAVMVASIPARWVAATAEVASAIPFGQWNWPGGWGGALLFAACEALLLISWALHRGHAGLPGAGRVEQRRPWQPRPAAPTAIVALCAALTAAAWGVGASFIVAVPVSDSLATPRDWSVVACDVGQGDAMLLRDPEQPDEVMLVDTGDDEALLEACLRRFGVERIALLVLSHDDRDHVGALSAVIDRTEFAVIAQTVDGEREHKRGVVEQLRAAQVDFTIATRGMRSGADAPFAWSVLAPDGTHPPRDANGASIVMTVEVRGTRVLLLGDTGREEHDELLRAHPGLTADVLKVAHHGSSDQSDALTHALGPRWALISVGADNGYGHPAAAVIASLEQAGATVLRTDQHGSIALSPTPDGVMPWAERTPRRSSRTRPSRRRSPVRRGASRRRG